MEEGKRSRHRGADLHHQQRKAAAAVADLFRQKLADGELEEAETEPGREWLTTWLEMLDDVAGGRRTIP